MVLARSCALTAVSAFLATWLGRERTCRAPAVARVVLRGDGQTRDGALRARRGAAASVPLLAWVVEQWEGTQLALALDATTLGTRFTVLALSVV